jgi:hypothetical protein
MLNANPLLLAKKKINCLTCSAQRISKEQLLFCQNSCKVKNWIEEHGYLNNKEEVLTYFTFKDKEKEFSPNLKKKNRKLDRHKDKFHRENLYREQILKMELEMRN